MPALLALLVALGQLPTPQLAQPGEQVTITSEVAELDGPEDRVRAEGHVVLESGGLRLLTEELDYRLDERTGAASGGLLLLDGTLAIHAREGTFALGDEERLSLEHAELWQKAPGMQAALRLSPDAATARRTGRNLLLLRAERLERISKGKFVARRMRLTACDCGPDSRPDWSISAREADVEPGERAILWWPAFYVKDVPILGLPAIYVPLSSRRTGFLFPRPGYSAQSGFFLDEPFFWALHESWDLTLTAGYRFGIEPQFDFYKTNRWSRVGAMGPRGSAELRYAPAEHTTGRLYASLNYDLHSDPEPNGWVLRPPRGWRGEMSFRHATAIASGLEARADLNFVSDANYLGDQAVDVIRDAPPYLRSQAWIGYRGEAAAAVVSAGWYQDFAAPFAVPERWLFGEDAPAGFQRPLAVALSVPRTRIVGPLHASLEATAVRLQALTLLAGDTPVGSRTLTRLDLAPRLAVPLLAGGPVSAEVYGGARGDLASYSIVGQEVRLHGRGFVGAWAGTELSRTFLAGTVKHVVEPRLEVRAATERFGDRLVLGPTELVPVDEFDERRDAFVQGVAALSTRLDRKARGTLARLELGQDVDLLAGRAADGFARLEVTPPYVAVGAGGRWDWQRNALAALGASLRANDNRGDALTLAYDRILAGGSDRMRATIDALFGAAAAKTDSAFSQLTASLAVTVIQGIALRYSAVMIPELPEPVLDRVVQHTGGIGLTTSCDCWRLDVYMTHVKNFGLNFGFLVDLKTLGSFGQ